MGPFSSPCVKLKVLGASSLSEQPHNWRRVLMALLPKVVVENTPDSGSVNSEIKAPESRYEWPCRDTGERMATSTCVRLTVVTSIRGPKARQTTQRQYRRLPSRQAEKIPGFACVNRFCRTPLRLPPKNPKASDSAVTFSTCLCSTVAGSLNITSRAVPGRRAQV